jgi:hypothetical protein
MTIQEITNEFAGVKANCCLLLAQLEQKENQIESLKRGGDLNEL